MRSCTRFQIVLAKKLYSESMLIKMIKVATTRAKILVQLRSGTLSYSMDFQ